MADLCVECGKAPQDPDSVYCHGCERRVMANARLIAAAPELLAALKECRCLLLYAAEGSPIDAPRAFAAVRSAADLIAKAEGRDDV